MENLRFFKALILFILLGSLQLSGQGAPAAVTDAASSITTTAAVLNGTVNANGSGTAVTFEYGLDTGYGKTTNASPSTVTGSLETPVSLPVSGLISGTTYHYRVVAVNGGGTTYGADMTFTTLGAPTVFTNAATAVGLSGATLNGTVNANNGRTTVTFQLGHTTRYGRTFTASPRTVSGSTATAAGFRVNTLVPDTTYHYRVVGSNGGGTAYGSDRTFRTGPAAIPTVTTAAVTGVGNVSAGGGGNVMDEGSAPVTARGVCWSTSPAPTTGGSLTDDGTGAGAFTSGITGLTRDTTYYVRAYATNVYGTAYGDEVQFTTMNIIITAAVTNPADGDTAAGTVNITANASVSPSSHSIGRVKFYIGGTLLSQDTAAPYEAPWDTSTVADGNHTIRAVAVAGSGDKAEAKISVYVLNNPPVLQVSPGHLNYGAVIGGEVPGTQGLAIANSGGGTLDWSLTFTESRLSCTPASGAGAGTVEVTVDHSGLAAGTYTGTIRVINDSSGVTGDSVSIPVLLTVLETSEGPFGAFESPANNSTVSGNVPLTGWALDDIEVVKVSIYRNPVPGEGGGKKYIGDAVFVEGARPDIEAQYPDYPLNSRAGWGYMLLTNALPDNKNGRYRLQAVAEDKEGNTATIGGKSIIVDNASEVKPFGAIDSPAPNEEISGTAYVNWGWALTPLPNTIPFDGSTITVYIDGVPRGNPVYNIYRRDVAGYFPGYNNSAGAGGYFTFDTTAFKNGRHSISWLVEDDAGNAEGIGSRHFKIKNEKKKGKEESHVVTRSRPVTDQPAEIGVGQLDVRAMQPIEFQVGNSLSAVRGYLSVNGELRALPLGSTLDHRNGRFYWVPVAGFKGTYRLVFFIEKADGTVESKNIDINIATK